MATPTIAVNCNCGLKAIPGLTYIEDEMIPRRIKCLRCSKEIGVIELECEHGHLNGTGCTWCDVESGTEDGGNER